jgi:prophage maintenance system killer protein
MSSRPQPYSRTEWRGRRPFSEGNKRTAAGLAKWLLDRNGENGSSLLPPDDRVVADLLVAAAAGRDVERQLIDVLQSRR